ncbi:MAG: primosomal protein N' [Pseudomonadota bacterium]
MAGNNVNDNVFFPEGTLIAVQTAQPLDRTLDYKSPPGGCAIGAFVEVPLGPRKVLGVVWGPGAGDFGGKMRSAIGVLDIPPMATDMREFLTRTGAYTLTPMNAMLRLATRAPGLMDTPGMRRIYGLGDAMPDRMTAARERVIAVLEEQEGQRFTLGELSSMAGVTSSVVKGLLKQGVLFEYETPRDTAYPPLDHRRAGKPLTAEQLAVAKELRAQVSARRYGTALLKGVTGSGKTEVYLEAVAATLAAGRQALVLLPEIALTAEFLDRVEARFGARPAEWHSGVTQTERRRCYRMVAAGKAQLVVGARSSLFLPFADLGLVVVDEEHDGSYKQEDGVLYNARDMAVLRASLCDATVVLASATPSLETWANAKSGKYVRHELKSRFGAAELPDMQAIDLRVDEPGTGQWISGTLAREVFARLDRKEQSLLFLNRRGYAPVTVCRACGEQIACDQCDARMVEHRFHGRLMCHQCGDTKPMPSACPSCGQEDRLAAVGPGVERLAEEATARFEGAQIAVLSSDMALSARGLKEKIRQIADGGADIIIGTQMVAKGHNFPLLTLVGVIDADLGLQGGDLRAAERTFQLVRQVAGRAGRADKKGVAYVQTHQPDHPVIQAILSGDEEEFWAAEAAQREQAGTPPYGRMAGVILSGPDIAQVHDVAGALARAAGDLRRIGAELYGPAPAPIARIRGRHRVRMLVKAAKGVPLQAAMARWVGQVKLPGQVRLSIDIDPQSFF